MGSRSMDPFVWKACAGNTVQIPTVDSLVYYFPQGHAEQGSAVPDFSSASCKYPLFTCRITGVQFLANKDTDEVYAKMNLDPRNLSLLSPSSSWSLSESSSLVDPGEVVSFAKILTASDANNGGGFSVPRFCAELILPRLDFKADPPVQTISVCDVHGTVWEFRHIFRGTPRRHLLTTGWSKFVNSKKLVAGDSVVFIKKSSGELFLGVRRTGRSGGGGSSEFLRTLVGSAAAAAWKPEESSGVVKEGFSRNCRGRVPPETVVEAVRFAEMGQPFEVMYYPRAGSPEFVVRKEAVEAAMKVHWMADMRVKMAVETEDSNRTTWFQGKVSCVMLQDLGPFPRSPWRMLEVTWDEPEVLQNVRSVCPWKVEIVSTSPQILSPYIAIKKPRLSQNQELLADKSEKNMLFPTSGNTSMMGSINQSLFSYNIFPAGMQGARHDSIYESRFSNLLPNDTHQNYLNNMPPKVNPVFNIESTLQSKSSSSQCQDTVHYHSIENIGKPVCKITRKEGGILKLFGKPIYVEETVDVDADSVNEGCKKSEGATGPLKFSYQGVSTVKAYNL